MVKMYVKSTGLLGLERFAASGQARALPRPQARGMKSGLANLTCLNVGISAMIDFGYHEVRRDQ